LPLRTHPKRPEKEKCVEGVVLNKFAVMVVSYQNIYGMVRKGVVGMGQT
jgi:hypothetical protein